MSEGEPMTGRPSRSDLGPVTRAAVTSLGWRSLNLHTHISLVHNYVYVEVPKAGCGTMKATLGGMEAARLNPGFVERVQANPHDRMKATPFVKPFQLPPAMLEEVLAGPKFRRFTVVRDPATRVLSGYLEKILQGLKQSEPIVTALTELTGEAIAAQDITFSQFLDVVQYQTPREQDPHWRIQTAHLNIGVINYDAIIHLEQLDQSWSTIAELTGVADLQEQFFCRNATHAGSRASDMYTPELREQVARMYASDYAAFGYTP
jgi:hypothetical protein